MVNPFWLTFAALLMTLRGDVPLETWTPLFKDYGMIILDWVENILLGVFT
jgi:hypothetical protein